MKTTMTNRIKTLALAVGLTLGISACTSTPDGIQPVQNFDAERYLGTWYEIARLDHSFEDGLSQVTAEYSRNDDGTIKVINRGYSEEDGEWDTAEGTAKFVEGPNIGHLKVSFFGPFYGSYVIFDLDQDNYKHSFVSGPDRDYLWLLSRTPTIDADLKARFLSRAQDLGFDTDELIFVDQSENAEKRAAD